MLTMVKDTLHPARVGRVVRADGPLVEARFDRRDLPEVRNSSVNPSSLPSRTRSCPAGACRDRKRCARAPRSSDGAWDDVSEADFRFAGGVDDVLARGARAG
jgi:hypothetical protein